MSRLYIALTFKNAPKQILIFDIFEISKVLETNNYRVSELNVS